MVFSSHPLYQFDPPNWQYHQHQQEQEMILYGGGNEISSSYNSLQYPPLQQQLPAATGSSSRNIRPGSMTDRARMAKLPLPETALKCPRCESTNTKFCYFNNYSLTQPRHFCKTCRRYWTRGGALRNVPVGGGCRRATKRSSKKRSKSPAVSGTANVTTTSTSTDQNGNNIIDDGVLQFPFYPQGGMSQMVHESCDHYIGGGNDYGGAHTDSHIARLVQTGVMSLTDSSMDHQWSKVGETTLKQMHSLPFPFLTNLAPQGHYSSQPSGLVYQFDQYCGGQLGLTGSSQVDALGNSNNSNAVMSIMDRTVAARFTDVKTEDGEKWLKRSMGLQAQAAVSNNSMANINSEFSMVGNQIGNILADVLGFASNEPTTCLNNL